VRPQTQIDGYAVETYVGADYQVGWPRLTKGRHTLSHVCLGRNAASSGYNLGEQVPVLRACANALGAIGRAATPALPVLGEIAKQPRVRWAAEAAVRSIEHDGP